MNIIRVFGLSIFVVMLFCYGQDPISANENKIVISGKVYDINYDPIDSIEIQIFRKKDKAHIMNVYSNKKGEYRTEIEKTSPIDIFYVGTGFISCYISGLIGSAEQVINKTMYLEKGAPITAKLEAIKTIEIQIAYASANNLPTMSLINKLLDYSPLFAAGVGFQDEKTLAALGQHRIENMQSYLKENGYYAGAVDGIIGCRTIKGMNEWASKYSKRVRGGINAQNLIRLGVEASAWNIDKNR